MELLGAGLGLLISFVLLLLLRPRLPNPWRWAWQGLGIHAGIWLLGFAAFFLLLGRPVFAAGICLVLILLVVQVSNAKLHALKEPFVFQDFEYFTDAIRHPRLYIPFLGWGKFFAIAAGVVLAIGGALWLEPSVGTQDGIAPRNGFALLLAGFILLAVCDKGVAPTFSPSEDLETYGFIGALWSYWRAERTPLKVAGGLRAHAQAVAQGDDDARGHVVVVQSESFFDPRPLFSGIRADVLKEFDRLRSESVYHGLLEVPAWGANTVRSEFGFLSGLNADSLGVHRFNPYRRLLDAEITSLAHVYKARGYRTICIHPYPASFYGRDRVIPHLGFDEFVDVRAFSPDQRSGPYTGDRAVCEKIIELLDRAKQPIFIFTITMENHGPLHLERVEPDDVATSYSCPPPAGCEDLSIYLRHLKNADWMVGRLREYLAGAPWRATLCWYGDHVPIMASVYAELGSPCGRTPYLVWTNHDGSYNDRRVDGNIGIHELGKLVSSQVFMQDFPHLSGARCS